MAHSIFQWIGLVAIIWLQCFSGTNSDFPAYSSQMKKLWSFSQHRLNYLAFASDAGKFFGFFSGVAAMYLPLWIVVNVGAMLGLISYGLQYLDITQQISHLSYLYIFILNIFSGNSICWVNTVCYIFIIQNFPFDPQVAVGLSTSYGGLSAKIYTGFVNVISSSNATARAKNYLLLNSILPMIVSLLALPILLKDDVNNKDNKAVIERSGLTIMFFVAIFTGIFSAILSFGWKPVALAQLVYLIGLACLLVIPLMIPLVLCKSTDDVQLPANATNNNQELEEIIEQNELVVEDSTSTGTSSDDTISTSNSSDDIMSTSNISGDDSIGSSTGIGSIEEIGWKMMLKRKDFWLYFFVYLFGATLGLVFMNNLGQIAESRGQSSTATSSLVSLSSTFCFFGRLLPSLLHHFGGDKYMVSTTTSIAVLMPPISIAFFLLAFESRIISLYISTIIIGLCIGSITSISVSATTELFGTKNFRINHNIIVCNIPIGTLIFGIYNAALFYDKQKQPAGPHNVNNICTGPKCYRTTFIIWGCISCVGAFLALLLYLGTRELYQRMKAAKKQPTSV